MINKLLLWIDRSNNKTGLYILSRFIYLMYRMKGKRVSRVRKLIELNVWEFTVDGRFYLSTGPGWAYDFKYLFKQLSELAGNYYMPVNNDIVLDIGAGVGEETIIFSELVGAKGKVYAIEAHPNTFAALAHLVKVNKLDNVTCSNIALADKSGRIAIEDTQNSLANSITEKTTGTVEVISETLDAYIDRHAIERIDLLKMNVEGAEQLIIKGMISSLHRIRHVAISCHDFRFKNGESEFYKTKDLVISFLQEHNFSVAFQQSGVSMVDDYVYATNPLFTAAN